MKYNVAAQEPNPIVSISELKDGTLAIATNGEFKGELFYRNVAGVVGISGNRYWPSMYMSKDSHPYIPDFDVRPITGGITITIQEVR
jgi:hypothetical protein